LTLSIYKNGHFYKEEAIIMGEKSRWVEIRDSIVEALKVEEIGKDLKSRFVGWLTTEGIGFIQPIADAIIDECKRDAPTESGWCKIRDLFVVPVAVNIGMALLKFILDKAAAEE
jgi:hypothetical protein